jgi:DNA-directed RNA polymerase subunit K/omega
MPVDLSPRLEAPDGSVETPGRFLVIHRPPGLGAFEFVVLATLRAAQLIHGCQPRVDGTHKAIVTAQIEVAEGKVMQVSNEPSAVGGLTKQAGAPEDAPIIVQPT